MAQTQVKKLQELMHKLQESKKRVQEMQSGGFLGLKGAGKKAPKRQGGAEVDFVDMDLGNTYIPIEQLKPRMVQGRGLQKVVPVPASQQKANRVKRGEPEQMGRGDVMDVVNMGNYGSWPTPDKQGRRGGVAKVDKNYEKYIPQGGVESRSGEMAGGANGFDFTGSGKRGGKPSFKAMSKAMSKPMVKKQVANSGRSAWIQEVKQVAAQRGIPYKDALKIASQMRK